MSEAPAPPSESPIAQTTTTLARALAAAGILVGLAGFAGSFFENVALFKIHFGLWGMSASAAGGVLICGLTLFAEGFRNRVSVQRLAAIGGWALLAIAVFMATLHVVAATGGASPWVAGRPSGHPEGAAAPESLSSAACLAFLGLSLVTRRRAVFSEISGAAALMISSLSLLAALYGLDDPAAAPAVRSLALTGALALVMLSAATLLAHPGQGWGAVLISSGAGGASARRQLAFLPLPLIGGWVLLAASQAGLLRIEAAMALLVVLAIAPMVILVLRDGRSINALDDERASKAAVQFELQTSLEQRLRDQAAELAAASDERAKAEEELYRTHHMEAVGQLTGGIAHEFNNLLMAVSGNLQLMLRRLEDDSPARKYAVNALTAVDRGAKLTAQLLAFSRTQKLETRPVELDKALSHARDLVGNALGPSIEVRMALGAAGSWAMLDPTQLELAILNLALNAREAMPTGGTLTIGSEVVRRRLDGAAEPVNLLAVSVTDTGRGMTPAVAQRATEPFFTTKERGKGTGLGLAQVYGFVRQSGGDLTIRSAPGDGSTIELLFQPAAADESRGAATVAEASRAKAAGKSRRSMILVIDDDVDVRAVIADALRGAGYEVTEAEDGPSGLAALANIAPAAAIIDFVMPGMDGAEVGRRARVLHPNLPLIFVSGYFDTAALDAVPGATVLHKPVNLDGLQRAVSSVLA
ncbi:ATP-binding protein [Phenylobacterium immobile]|uniref:ATP-binding protein n=1 Tax=Phenylobacterium immobile TaxID=21 RepID=UPI000A42BC5B|nr:ATP-binding protein [Phenylobacterium immobile]